MLCKCIDQNAAISRVAGSVKSASQNGIVRVGRAVGIARALGQGFESPMVYVFWGFAKLDFNAIGRGADSGAGKQPGYALFNLITTANRAISPY